MRTDHYQSLQLSRFKSNIFINPCTVFLLTVAVVLSSDSVKLAGAADLDASLYASLDKLHGHTCAGSIIGARIGLAAKAVMKHAGGEGRLKSRYFDHSCAVDGIQVAAGTTYGNRDLEVEDRNEHRLLLSAETNHRQVEARLTKLAESKAKTSLDLKRRSRVLPSGSAERQRMEKEIEKILDWFRLAPEADVVTVKILR